MMRLPYPSLTTYGGASRELCAGTLICRVHREFVEPFGFVRPSAILTRDHIVTWQELRRIPESA